MQILVINAGSTSLKYKLFGIPGFKLLKENSFTDIKDHETALKLALREIGNLSEVQAIGHRVVHGGPKFFNPIQVDDKNFLQISNYNYLAPLHNPYNLAGIKATKEYLPQVPNVAVFDTGFYKDLPDQAKIYAIPLKYYEKYNIQRYGFHGLSHAYVAWQAAEKLRKPLEELKLITVHLGGGASITATKEGQAIDTSMGFTPLEGLVMMSRPGDLDPGVIVKLCEITGSVDLSDAHHQINEILNKKSGIKGLSGIDDYLTLLKEVSLGNKQAKLAFEIFVYRIKKYIGAYYAALGGLDAIVFTGAIGAGNPITRRKATEGLPFLKDIKVLSMTTNEELMIAREVSKLLKH